MRLDELKTFLLARNYPEKLLDSSINRARKIPRKVALLKVRKKEEDIKRPVFAVKYDPRLPSIEALQAKHWRSMIGQNKYLNEVFKKPPLTAYRRQRNLRDILIKAKVPPAQKRYPQREGKGMTKCGKDCTICPYVMTGSEIKINNKENWHINRKVSCDTYNCIYMIECQKCGRRYIGESGRIMRARLAEHRGYINNQVIGITTGDHFNLPGHSLAHMKVTILEKVRNSNPDYRREREKYFINRFNTFYEGMNKEI